MGSAIFTCIAMISAGIAALAQYVVVHGLMLQSLSAYALTIYAALAIHATIMPASQLHPAL